MKFRCWFVLAALWACTACRDSDLGLDAGNPGSDATTDGSNGYPEPRSNLVPAVGSAATLEIAAWNIENFPKDPSTAAMVADLITSMNLDVVVVSEVASEAAWNELAARLREHEAVLSPHVYASDSYQKLGILYRRPLVTVRSMLRLLFNGQDQPFPRPPIQLSIEADDGVHAQLLLDLIGVHLKAGVAPIDRERRTAAITLLDGHVQGQVAAGGEDEVVVLGDFNEVITDAGGQATMAPFLNAPLSYRVQTAPYAQAGGVTYLGFGGKAIDHLVTTQGLAAELVGSELVVPPLQNQLNGYRTLISDHLPVVLKVPLR